MEHAELILPWKPATIYGVSDLQLGSAGCVVHLFEEDMAEARSDRALCLGLGDDIDFVRPTMRKLLRVNESDTEMMDTLTTRAIDHETHYLEMVAGTKWIGKLKGHHYWDFGGGITSDTRLAKALHCPYLGDSCTYRITFRDKLHEVSTNIWAWHGEGSGSVWSALAKLAKQAGHWDCDIFLMGHYSQLGAVKFHRMDPRIDADVRELVSRDITLGLTGGYQKGYVSNLEIEGRPQGTYVEQRGLPPVSLGCLRLRLTPTNDGVRVRATI